MQQQGTTKNKPIHDIRLGLVKAAIWKHDNENGPWYSVSINRSYKDKDGDEWKQTDFFNRDDLLLVAKVADLAHTFVCEKLQERGSQDREGGNGGRFRGNK
jgi:hypothetical protein